MSRLIDDLRASFKQEMTGPERIADAMGKATTDDERAKIRAIAYEQINSASHAEVTQYRKAVGESINPEDDARAAEQGMPVLEHPQPTTGPIQSKLDALDKCFQTGHHYPGKAGPIKLDRGSYNRIMGELNAEMDAAKEHDAKMLDAYRRGDAETYSDLHLATLPPSEPGRVINIHDLNSRVHETVSGDGFNERMATARTKEELTAILRQDKGQHGLVSGDNDLFDAEADRS